MATTPLTRRIADMATDALIIAGNVQCPIRRETLTKLLQRINRQADRLHTARLAARGIEDNGYVSDWTRRHMTELERAAERAGELDTIERRALPIGRAQNSDAGLEPDITATTRKRSRGL